MTGQQIPKKASTELFVAVDIGCIECGEESKILGVFSKKKDAIRICDEMEMEQNKNWSGQHSFEVFVVPAIDVPLPRDYAED